MAIHSSAQFAAVSEYRGSMTMVRTPESRMASFRYTDAPPPHIFVSRELSPNKTRSFEFFTSSGVLASRVPYKYGIAASIWEWL